LTVTTAWLVVGLGVVWFGQALLLSRVMSRHGCHPLPWFMVPLLLGPAAWPLALIEALSGPPAPELLRRGERGPGALDVFVLFEADHVPEGVKAELQRLAPRLRRLVLARVIKAGGPTMIQADATRFLKGITTPIQTRDAALQIVFGDITRVVAEIEERGDIDVLIRTDHARKQFHSDGYNLEERWIHDAPAA
jgi:hypothetical protein